MVCIALAATRATRSLLTAVPTASPSPPPPSPPPHCSPSVAARRVQITAPPTERQSASSAPALRRTWSRLGLGLGLGLGLRLGLRLRSGLGLGLGLGLEAAPYLQRHLPRALGGLGAVGRATLLARVVWEAGELTARAVSQLGGMHERAAAQPHGAGPHGGKDVLAAPPS